MNPLGDIGRVGLAISMLGLGGFESHVSLIQFLQKNPRRPSSCSAEKKDLAATARKLSGIGLTELLTVYSIAGWWFGCHFLFSHILGF